MELFSIRIQRTFQLVSTDIAAIIERPSDVAGQTLFKARNPRFLPIRFQALDFLYQ